jgi:uncharacterized cupin superfamily protein
VGDAEPAERLGRGLKAFARRLTRVNVWDAELEPFIDREPFRSRRARLVDPAAARLGASVWEIAPHSTQVPYHFHHVQEELVLVLRGRPTLRTPSGERQLGEGDLVHFATGPDGAHALRNDTEEAVRVLWVSELADAEVAEYPESGRVRVVTRGESQRGERLATQFRLDDGVDYLDGE